MSVLTREQVELLQDYGDRRPLCQSHEELRAERDAIKDKLTALEAEVAALRVGESFYRLTVRQRDAAWVQTAKLAAEGIERQAAIERALMESRGHADMLAQGLREARGSMEYFLQHGEGYLRSAVAKADVLLAVHDALRKEHGRT